jgi:hypothetical protein
MNAWEVLGVRPGASHDEVAEAYRVLAQIFHPDRFADSPEKIKEEAQRRMQDLNDAYAQACNGGLAALHRNGRPPPSAPPRGSSPRYGGPATSTQAFNPNWETAARYRATMAARHREHKEAEERSLPRGQAVARPRPASFRPSMLLGLGLARTTNKLRCRGCNSVQLLPPGWRETLRSMDFHCSLCGRCILAR